MVFYLCFCSRSITHRSRFQNFVLYNLCQNHHNTVSSQLLAYVNYRQLWGPRFCLKLEFCVSLCTLGKCMLLCRMEEVFHTVFLIKKKWHLIKHRLRFYSLIYAQLVPNLKSKVYIGVIKQYFENCYERMQTRASNYRSCIKKLTSGLCVTSRISALW